MAKKFLKKTDSSIKFQLVFWHFSQVTWYFFIREPLSHSVSVENLLFFGSSFVVRPKSQLSCHVFFEITFYINSNVSEQTFPYVGSTLCVFRTLFFIYIHLYNTCHKTAYNHCKRIGIILYVRDNKLALYFNTQVHSFMWLYTINIF